MTHCLRYESESGDETVSYTSGTEVGCNPIKSKTGQGKRTVQTEMGRRTFDCWIIFVYEVALDELDR